MIDDDDDDDDNNNNDNDDDDDDDANKHEGKNTKDFIIKKNFFIFFAFGFVNFNMAILFFIGFGLMV